MRRFDVKKTPLTECVGLGRCEVSKESCQRIEMALRIACEHIACNDFRDCPPHTTEHCRVPDEECDRVVVNDLCSQCWLEYFIEKAKAL